LVLVAQLRPLFGRSRIGNQSVVKEEMPVNLQQLTKPSQPSYWEETIELKNENLKAPNQKNNASIDIFF